MPNNYFQFKQFLVRQERCSMKVCTDACIFGSVLPASPDQSITHVLDIGTGTGLLSLMHAQKDPAAIIDAVEIEQNAYEQAKENFEDSSWKERLKVFHTDIKDFVPSKKYHLIISNPPFYENDLLSNESNKNIAKHDEGLTLKELIRISQEHLADTGTLAVLLPFKRIQYFEQLAGENGLFIKYMLLIKQTPEHNFFRGILLFSKTRIAAATDQLIIKDEKGNYTEGFVGLMKDYYLNL